MASKKRISKLTGKPVRAYKKRAAASEKGAAKKEVQAARGGTRAGAGRKSSEVHFAQMNAKIDTLAGLFALAAEKMGVDQKAIAVLYTEPKQVQPEPVQVVTAQPVAVIGHVETAPQAVAAAAPTQEKRKPGRPRKLQVTAPAAAAPVAVQPVVPPVAPVAQPAPVPVIAVAPVAQPVVAAPIQGQPTWPLQQQVQPVQTAPAPQFIPAPVAQAGIPVTFTPPPPPPPVQPQFAVGVAPLNVQPVAPVQPAPAQNGAVDFEAQFQAATQQPK
jgi:hypothetical protein